MFPRVVNECKNEASERPPKWFSENLDSEFGWVVEKSKNDESK